MRLRELLHEVQRERARDERLAGRKPVPATHGFAPLGGRQRLILNEGRK